MDISPGAIAAAWKTWHSRHGGKLGPGPAFSEAVSAGVKFAISEISEKENKEIEELRAEIFSLKEEIEFIKQDGSRCNEPS